MKTNFLLPILFLFLITVSCSQGEPAQGGSAQPDENYVDATSKTTWHYFSFSSRQIVGQGEENSVDNALWAARTDWDIAINRYLIRTNSGAATSVSANGGVYTLVPSSSFESVITLPNGAVFTADKVVTVEGMGGATTTVQSEAVVILFKKNEDGSSIMPPVYLQAPVYIFRTANGTDYYKVQFFQYQNENKITGHVKFYSAQLK